MNWKNVRQGARLLIFAIGAGLFLIATWILAMEDKASSATVTAAVGFGFAMLYFLPLVESFEAFGLSAKLRTQVNQAETLLNNIRNTAAVSSKFLVEQIAWQGRLGTSSWSSKCAMLAAINDNLIEIGVDEKIIETVREPLLRFLSFDLYRIFASVVQERYQFHRSIAAAELRNEFPTNQIAADSAARYNELVKHQNSFNAPNELLRANPEQAYFSVGEKVTEVVPQTPFSPAEHSALLALGEQIASIADGCWKAGTVTASAEAYLEKYGGTNAWRPLYDTAFGDLART